MLSLYQEEEIQYVEKQVERASIDEKHLEDDLYGHNDERDELGYCVGVLS